MSLVRPAAFFENHEFYLLNEGNDMSRLSTAMFDSDNQGIIYATESHSSDSYDPKYFLDSSSDDLAHTPGVSQSCSYRLMAENSPCSSSIVASQHETDQFNDKSEHLRCQTHGLADCNEDKLTLKLQQIEKALLDDGAANGSYYASDAGHGMEIDGVFSNPTSNLVFHHSPKETLSLESNFCGSLSSSKETAVTALLITKHLLFECAAAIQSGNVEEASSIINELRHRVSIQGDPSERIAAYMVEALVARMATSGRGLYKALRCKEPPSLDRLSAMQVLFEACPCFRFGFMAANGAILDASKDEKTVHIIDFDINQGSQYYTLLQTLAKTPGRRPHVRLTGVDDPESVQRTVGGLNVIGRRLEQLAADLQISFEFKAVPSRTALVSPSMLDCRAGEALLVNFAFQLHHMPDESVSTLNLRDQLLRMVKSLKPKLVTVVEQDVNTNTAPFLPRFAEAYNYYNAVFESLDATLPRNSQDRMNVEKQCLARDIINVTACEGEERIERYEVAGKWRARMSMAGFTTYPISQNVKIEIQKLIKQYSERYKVKEEMGALHFGWKDKTLIVASAWK